MNVFVIGSGGREHAICWALAKSPKVNKVFVAPGNGGTAAVAENVDIDTGNIQALVRFARDNDIALTVPGPEAVLMDGVVDAFMEADLPIFGPTKLAAEIEGSKSFAKNLMRKHGIPTADYGVFDRLEDAVRYIEDMEDMQLVVKADGLAAGKGVIVCSTKEEAVAAVRLCMEDKSFGTAGNRVVIEERMFGEEVSILALTDGKTIAPLSSAQDHKPIFDNDKGPNTGGMGAYSPAPVLTDELLNEAIEKILVPTVHAMNREGRRYKGVLYAGLMITGSGPRVVEFNCRFGDPEIQPISMRLDTDIFDLLSSVVDTKLGEMDIKWKDDAAVSVVMASGGYPGDYEKGKVISGLDEAGKLDGVEVFHAGTSEKSGQILTAGGRVLNVTALGSDIPAAIKNAYKAVDLISFEGAQFRTDIGKKALVRLGQA
ncbi:MAG: phosphoribosylamine--glycine ligase [Planctomycetota bacterium]|jgi:phosphoribosylamine--glycine ligase